MNKIYCVIVLAFITISLQAQEITQVKQERKTIIVEYTIPSEASTVDLYISRDGGTTFTGPLRYVEGDTKAVSAGNKSIRWNPIKEFGELKGDDIRFKLVAKMKRIYEKQFFLTANVAYAVSPQLSYGLTFGQVKRIGWYVSVMSNFNFKTQGDYECDYEGFVNGKMPFYSGKLSRARLSVMGGMVMKIVPSLAWTLGVGYGNRTLCWETEDGQWVKNTGYSTQGLDAAMGLQGKFGHFVVSLEAVTTNFKTLEAKLGLGFSF